MKETTPQRHSPLALWSWWVVATSIGGTLGWAIAQFLAGATLGAGLLLAGTTVGIGIGWAQGLVVAEYFRKRTRDVDWAVFVFGWLFLSAISGTVGWILILLIRGLMVSADTGLRFNIEIPVLGFAGGGAVFGMGQWLAFRRGVWIALWWILANAVGWSIGVYATLRVAARIHRSNSPELNWSFFNFSELIAGSLGIAIFAIITGMTLILLLRKPSVAGKLSHNTDY